MPHSGWAVTDQATDQVINTTDGRTITGTYVYFVTGNGNRASVFVPDDHYNAKNVHGMVEARATVVDEVGALANGLKLPPGT